MSFRYLAGYTPQPGHTAKAATVSVQIRDQATDSIIKIIQTTAPLGNYSWDHFTEYSPPIEVSAFVLCF